MSNNPFERDDLQAPLAEINMTPLVDVMLVLVVIFLVTAPMLTNAISLNLPDEGAAQVSQERVVSIAVTADGRYFLDNHEISESELDNALQGMAKAHKDRQIHLRADQDASYGKVSHILAAAQRYGLHNIGFITEPK
jgi:biopolymer transport protein ExbD